MNKKVLCRFMVGGRVFKIVEREELGGRWSDYVIMQGRRRAEPSRVYNTFALAWEDFVSICRGFIDYDMERGAL